MTTQISASLVKDLREKTGAGMMDCKRALTETKGDFKAAEEWLRKKGLSAAAKKSSRVAAEGLVGIMAASTKGALVEVNAETDFVARNERFQGFVLTLTELALKTGADVETLKATTYPGKSHTVAEELTQMIATIGENMNLRRVAHLSVNKGIVTAYVHNSITKNLGKIGVLVGLESTATSPRLEEVGRQIAMHVAASKPEALDIASVDQANLERERRILSEQARASGKPEEIIAKMVEGRIRKYYEEVVLLEQPFVMDQDKRVKQVVESLAKELNAPTTIKGFVRFTLGEGIEKENKDFAAEVAAAAKVG